MKRRAFNCIYLFTSVLITQAAGIIQDDFSSGSVTRDSLRIYETDIDDGWQADQESAWTIADGTLQNAGTATSGIFSEGAVAQVVALSGQGGRYLDLSFDYTGSAYNQLTVHLWGYTGAFDGDDEWFANFQVQNGGYYNNWNGPSSSGEVHGYSLKDGSDDLAPYPLVSLIGSGSYSNRIDIPSLGIPGVSNVSDFAYINLAFGRKNYSGASNTTVDAVNLSAWPTIDANHRSGPVPLTVVFDASANSASDDIVSCSWDFGDGSYASGIRATNTYTETGSFTTALTIVDSGNQTNTATVRIIVLPELADLGAIWFIGDSITQSNADGDPSGSPRKALYDLLVAHDYAFTYTGHFTANVDGLPTTGAAPADNLYHYHSGISGSVIGNDYSGRTGMTGNMSTFWNSGRLALVKPDIILIMLGANDVNLELDLPGAPARLEALIQAIYDLPGVGAPRIFLAQITPNRTDDPPDPANVTAFNAAVPGIVSTFRMQGRDVRLVDQFTPINNNYAANMRPDNLHPNAAGNAVMAQQWFNAITEKWPGVPSDFHGFDLYTFQTNGLSCKVAAPDVGAAGKPWIWRARFWDHQSGPDVALLSNGFHVVNVDVAGLYGAPSAVARFDAFYDFLTLSYGFDNRAALEGMSRGGLIVYNWAVQNSDKVHCIYADAPVCDFKSWPGGFGIGAGSPSDWTACKTAYGFTEEEALAYDGNPVETVQSLAAAGIPLLHVVGDDDLVVPVSENTAIIEARCNAYGGLIQVIHKPGVGHVHGLDDPGPIVDFVMNSVYAQNYVPMFVPPAALSNGVFNVRFAGTTGQHYRVESADDLTGTNAWWTVDDIAALPVSPMDVIAPMTNAAGFYRIRWFPW